MLMFGGFDYFWIMKTLDTLVGKHYGDFVSLESTLTPRDLDNILKMLEAKKNEAELQKSLSTGGGKTSQELTPEMLRALQA